MATIGANGDSIWKKRSEIFHGNGLAFQQTVFFRKLAFGGVDEFEVLDAYGATWQLLQ
jgi:hypothetical protein